jgi:hypothetical protein
VDIEGGSNMGSHEEVNTAPEKGSRDASQIAPAWFLFGSRVLFLGIKKAPEAVPEHGFRSWFSVRFSMWKRENYFAPNRENEVAP